MREGSMNNFFFRLEQRVALVTGAGRGIGRAVSASLAGAGAKVVVADIIEANALRTAEELGGDSRNVTGCFIDVTDRESVESVVLRTKKIFERLDILVNNAGVMFRTRFLDIDPSEWDKTILANLTGVFHCTQAAVPLMKENGYGRIINVSSSAGRSVSTLGGAHYTASKAGLLGFTRAVAKEVAPLGITVNAVCPGLIDTQMARETTSPEELEGYIAAFPVRRLGAPEEIGQLVRFLSSEAASYITGASIDINGGDLMV
jgi:3-oxoacyl-[acyl-carrier protein] reductase